jgi:FtsP/CotA-like multicopper oxidase with cupredoxin domain
MGKTSITRRTFVRAMGGAFGAVAAAGLPVSVLAARPRPTATRNPLFIPPTVSAAGYALGAAPATLSVQGQPRSVLAYNGYLPGPTFRASRGGSADVTLMNGLAQETTVHWHGMVVPPAADGHPRDAVAPGGTYSYQFAVNQRAALNWYHPHTHMLTGEQVALGLAGAFIVNDDEEAALALPSGAYEVPLVVRDANIDSSGALTYTAKSSGFLGKIPLVNGTQDAGLAVDTALYRFRVLCGSNARLFRLALSNGAPFAIIGNDGGLLAATAWESEIEIAPGERLDLLVDFRTLAVGTKVMLRDLNAGWDLLELTVARQVTDTTAVPASLSTIVPLGPPVTTREFSFDGMSRINGSVYDINRIDFEVPFGQTELWRFRTGGNAPHPVHVHGASFQVQRRTGGRGTIFSWERGWKDTVLLQDGETVEVLVRFDGFRGLYVMHCHKLEHEDMGMMANFVVV